MSTKTGNIAGKGISVMGVFLRTEEEHKRKGEKNYLGYKSHLLDNCGSSSE